MYRSVREIEKLSLAQREGSCLVFIFIFLATIIIFYMNLLMFRFCIQKEIPEEKHHQIIRTANIATMILLISSYVEILFT